MILTYTFYKLKKFWRYRQKNKYYSGRLLRRERGIVMEKLNNFERVKEQLLMDIEAHLIKRKKSELDCDEELRLYVSFFDNICGVLHFGFISDSEYEQLKDLIYESFPVEFLVHKPY